MAEYTSCFSQQLGASVLRDQLIGYLRSFICVDNNDLTDEDLLCLAMWSVIAYDADTWRRQKALRYIHQIHPALSVEELADVVLARLSSSQIRELQSLLDYTRVYLEADRSTEASRLRELVNQTPIAFRDESNRNRLRVLCAALGYLISAHNQSWVFSQGYRRIVQEVLGTPEAELSESAYADMAEQGRQYLLHEGMLKPFMLSDVLYQKHFGAVEQYLFNKYK